VEGAWSSAWHILPNAGLNSQVVNSTSNPPVIVPIVNHTGPAQVFLLASHFPPRSYFPTNGSFRITITFVAGGKFRLSGYWTCVGPAIYRFNPKITYPDVELKYGLLFSFIFFYDPAWMNATNSAAVPYLNVTQDFTVIHY
jgi:hypothetical protein